MKLESAIEKRLGTRLSAWSDERGIKLLYLKLSVPGFRGWPDRLLLWEGRGVLFVELKRPGETPRRLQIYVHRMLHSFGFEVQVHDNEDIAMEEITRYVDSQTGAGEGS